jgi:hypothetical protein
VRKNAAILCLILWAITLAADADTASEIDHLLGFIEASDLHARRFRRPASRCRRRDRRLGQCGNRPRLIRQPRSISQKSGRAAWFKAAKSR